MATRLLLTIDTELTWRSFARGDDWRSNLAASFDPARVGIPWQLRQLADHGLKACFFVDPMPALVYGSDPIRRMVEPILEHGQEVQLHLHSFWHDLANGRTENARFELTLFYAEGQRRLIETARNLLIAAGAPPPIAFRAGSYAANADTLAALRALGFRYDSSHNGSEHPSPSALPIPAGTIDPRSLDGLVEIPITQILRRDGGLRPLQLCAVSSLETRAALRHASVFHHPLVTMVSHSFELATRDGRRVNRLVRGRFERLCKFLARNRDLISTVHMAELEPLPLGARSHPLPANGLREFHRMTEQAWGDARYERPAFGAAAVSVPSLAAIGLAAYAAG